MNKIELVERYVNQVGRYLPPKERAEVEKELRSSIQDQLEDRYAGTPSEAEVAMVLTELGDPRQMASSYGSQQYLIGPNLYPNMMGVLQAGWACVPVIVIVLDVLAALASAESSSIFELFWASLWSAGEATLTFSAIVVLIFAVIQHSDEGSLNVAKKPAFNPLDLPAIDNPGNIDRFDMAFTIAFSIFEAFVFIYFLYVGGLTLRFNPSNPGEVISFPLVWMILLLITHFAYMGLHLFVLLRNRWSVETWLTYIVLTVFSVICGYFVVFKPAFDHIEGLIPAESDLQLSPWLPEIVTISIALITLITGAFKLIKLMNYRNSHRPSFTVQTDS